MRSLPGGDAQGVKRSHDQTAQLFEAIGWRDPSPGSPPLASSKPAVARHADQVTMALVATVSDAGYVPEQVLQQLMAKHKLDDTCMRAVANSGLLTCDMLAASGEKSKEFLEPENAYPQLVPLGGR